MSFKFTTATLRRLLTVGSRPEDGIGRVTEYFILAGVCASQLDYGPAESPHVAARMHIIPLLIEHLLLEDDAPRIRFPTT